MKTHRIRSEFGNFCSSENVVREDPTENRTETTAQFVNCYYLMKVKLVEHSLQAS